MTATIDPHELPVSARFIARYVKEHTAVRNGEVCKAGRVVVIGIGHARHRLSTDAQRIGIEYGAEESAGSKIEQFSRLDETAVCRAAQDWR